MADIFISYATADRETAKALTSHLEHLGYSVWWDREIGGGERFRDVIDEEIQVGRFLDLKLVDQRRQEIYVFWRLIESCTEFAHALSFL